MCVAVNGETHIVQCHELMLIINCQDIMLMVFKVCLVYTTKSIPTFSILLSLLSRPCVSSVAKLSVFGVDRCLSASVSMVEDGSTLAMAFNRSSTVIYTKQYTLASEHICTCSSWVMQNPIISCQVLTGFIFLVRAYSGCPGKEAVKWV